MWELGVESLSPSSVLKPAQAGNNIKKLAKAFWTYTVISFTFFAFPSTSGNVRTTRCTIGMSLPRTLYTTISPTSVLGLRFHRNSRSPRWKAGSIEPDNTTTIGELDAEATERPFHSMKAVDKTSAKLRTCAIVCRAFARLEESDDSMAGGL